MLAAVYWARSPRVALPDRALCLPTFCHSLLTVNKPSSFSPFSTRSIASPVGSYATAHPAPALPSALSPLPPLLACDAHAPTPLLVTRRSKLYQVSKPE